VPGFLRFGQYRFIGRAFEKEKKKLDPMTQVPLPVLDITYAYEYIGSRGLLPPQARVRGYGGTGRIHLVFYFYFLLDLPSWLFLYYLMAPSPSPLG